MRTLLRQFLTDTLSIGSIDPQPSIEGRQDIPLDSADEVIIDGKRDIVCESFVRN